MRSIVHPGVPSSCRIVAIPAFVKQVDTFLPTHQTLLSAVTAVAEAMGAKSGVFRLEGGAFTSFSYVMPALSTSPDHAVYFSETFSVKGQIRLESASLTYGVRAGLPWLHCHAIWVEPSGRRHCGHLLPDRVTVAEPSRLTGVMLDGATFIVGTDAETQFSLFSPVATTPSVHRDLTSKQAYAVRIAPNEDLCSALETFCQSQQINHATILGGVGSTVGAVFQDGRAVHPFVTELLIRGGQINLDSTGQARSEIDISIVDYLGGVSEGRLARGGNPVLVTVELVICLEK